LIKKLPKTFVVVCDLDILRDEGIAYAERMREAGVEVELKNYERCPHQIVALDKLVPIGAKMLSDICEATAKALGTARSVSQE